MNLARRSVILMVLLAGLTDPVPTEACWLFGHAKDCPSLVSTSCLPLCFQGPVVLMPQPVVGTVIPVEAVDPLASGGLSRNDGGIGPFLAASRYEWNPSTFGGASGPGGSPFLFDLRQVATQYPIFGGSLGRGGSLGGSGSPGVGTIDPFVNPGTLGPGFGPFPPGSLLDHNPLPLGPDFPGIGNPTTGVGGPSCPGPGGPPGSGTPSGPSPGVIHGVPEPSAVISTLAGLAIAAAACRLRGHPDRLFSSRLWPRKDA
ncbi:hypothetical protein P12x_000454 [Tundrisphaera lichenicola]|uniref:hypothetical protein n=1 Tax=Tundrisphaera lichenicola TaxID=2029860 RepID=UPI003EBC9900